MQVLTPWKSGLVAGRKPDLGIETDALTLTYQTYLKLTKQKYLLFYFQDKGDVERITTLQNEIWSNRNGMTSEEFQEMLWAYRHKKRQKVRDMRKGKHESKKKAISKVTQTYYIFCTFSFWIIQKFSKNEKANIYGRSPRRTAKVTPLLLTDKSVIR